MLDYKRAQVGDTLTWFVATIIIVVILFLAILASSFSSLLGGGDRKVISGIVVDQIKHKEVISYLVTPLPNSFVFLDIISYGNLNTQTGDLALKIFRDNLESKYDQASLLVSYRKNNQPEQLDNPYFKKTTQFSCNKELSDHYNYCDIFRLNNDLRLDTSFSK